MTGRTPRAGDSAAAARRGRAVAALYARAAPELLEELCAAAGLAPGATRARAGDEWAPLAAYACVRALVAACGFGPQASSAIEAFHDALRDGGAWPSGAGSEGRAFAAARYEVYGAIVREAATDDPATLAARLGAAAAERMAGSPAPAALAELAGSLHEALYEAALEAARGVA